MDLRAQNLNIFVQLAEGVDEETWRFHLKNADISKWLREAVKDPELADEVGRIERDDSLDDRESRSRVAEAILNKYSAPE